MKQPATLVAALAAAAVASAAPATVTPPARLQVTAKEFYLALSSPTVKSGPAIVELVNFGEDPHDMRLRRVGGGRVYRIPVVQPGRFRDLSLKLLPGRYKLWCSLPPHEALGMKAFVTVRQR
ncbi:MAG: hypothetical protein WCJ67_09445 [Thermoleophilia bacterium]